jgi:amidophosphoribosyltransferase
MRYPNVYGIDMPARTELVAHGRTTEDIAATIGADLVIFQTLPDLIASVRQWNPNITEFDCSVFTGHYVTGHVDEKYLGSLERMRADHVKSKPISEKQGVNGKAAPDRGDGDQVDTAGDTVGLYNSWKVNRTSNLFLFSN